MLAGDNLDAARSASEAFRGLAQFWDSNAALGKELAHSIGADGWTAWDVYVVYPPGAEWTAQGLPAPAGVLAQAGGAVVASRGVLPAAEIQAYLPKALSDRVDVVGEQADLERLLAQMTTAALAKQRPSSESRSQSPSATGSSSSSASSAPGSGSP
jgi:hypothetical protein